MDIKLSLLALLVGFVFGSITTFLKLPLSAPNALPGITGIIGIYLGYLFINLFK